MPDTNLGDNAVQFDRNAALASLKADVSKIETEAKLATEPKGQEPTATADTTTQTTQETTPAKEQKAPEDGKKEPESKVTDKSGEMSEEQLQNGIEHLKKDMSRKEALLKEYKELQRKYTPVAQEVKRLEKEVKAPESSGQIPEDFRKKFSEDLEKDPVAALVKYVDFALEEKINSRVKPDIENLKDGVLDTRRATEIDELVNEGHDWILKEGLGKFDAVFAERPWLLQSHTPYKDAAKFLPNNPTSKGTSHSPAQGGKTPILSASGAVPPPVSQTSTVESDYAALESQFDRAMKIGNVKEAKKIQSKMGALLGQR